ncbi:hypothetical protein POJ06DRAFT_257013 [Lipomyces tetrasporus]|uniref:Uncharacterized protein n=1 Tax=Lipomyces tetrasporus TaxID=54092 RepID=A0AAD7VR07_9ASCO|nr:uncharacterized protein POJ06DRAFT_257013 [Lipomyces tetrasporus]KAJ8099457.1 hypothetical protein POJ06DRAFT_257013 [Lipomyces tetrasporus]
MMISTATKLKTAINLFCHQYRENNDGLLSEKDWQDLQKLQDFLLFFYADASLDASIKDKPQQHALARRAG